MTGLSRLAFSTGTVGGNPYSGDFRTTQVWVRHKGNWQIVAFQVNASANEPVNCGKPTITDHGEPSSDQLSSRAVAARLPHAGRAAASSTRTVSPATSTLGLIRRAQSPHNHRNTILCWVAPAVLAISKSSRKSFPSSEGYQPAHEGFAQAEMTGACFMRKHSRNSPSKM
jgi:hypothetical protein